MELSVWLAEALEVAVPVPVGLPVCAEEGV